MRSTTSDESLELWALSLCRESKVLEGLWPVNQAQPTWNREPGAVASAAPGWQVLRPVTDSSIVVFIQVLEGVQVYLVCTVLCAP